MSAVYQSWKGALIIGEPDTLLLASTVRAMLLSGAYLYDATHKFLSDVPPAARVATSDPLADMTVNISEPGAFDSDNPVIAAVTGDPVVAVALYIDTGDDATSRLVLFQDSGLTGIPFTPNGSDQTLTVNPEGWFIL